MFQPTSLQGTPFRPFDEHYLITRIEANRRYDDFASLSRVLRAAFGKSRRAQRSAGSASAPTGD